MYTMNNAIVNKAPGIERFADKLMNRLSMIRTIARDITTYSKDSTEERLLQLRR